MSADGGADGAAQPSTAERLVHRANQIGRYFASQPHSDAVEGVADHIRKFWDPRMRKQALEYLAAGGAGLEPVAKAALEKVGAGAAG